MADSYRNPSFGFFALRAASIVAAILLFGFIIWGIGELGESSSFLAGLIRILLIIIVIVVVGSLIWLGIRLLTTSTGLNLGRAVSIVLGVLILGFIVWGIFRLAGTSDDSAITDETSTSNVDDESTAGQSNQQNQSNSGGQTQGQSTGGSSSANAQANQTPTTGGSDLPSTGPEQVVLSAVAAGIFATSLRSYISSRRTLNEIN